MDHAHYDRLAATEVMGWTGWYVKDHGTIGERVLHGESNSLDYWEDPTTGARYPCGFSPSTDINDAWRLVEKLREGSDGHFTLLAFTSHWRAGWATPHADDCEYGDSGTTFDDFICGDTAAEAICIAAIAEAHERARRGAPNAG